MAKKVEAVKVAPEFGYGIVVGGPHPYVSSIFQTSLGCPSAKAIVAEKCTEKYHKVTPMVMLTRADYRRLRKGK